MLYIVLITLCLKFKMNVKDEQPELFSKPKEQRVTNSVSYLVKLSN